jgi:hypothetical protein
MRTIEMTKPLLVVDDLKSRFREFDEIAEITGQLADTLKDLNEENASAGGRDDAVAKAYHKQIDEPTGFLTDLVRKVQQEFHLTGEKGGAAADNFDRAHDDALSAATDW